MLVICEDCAKKYNINESRIQGTRARFICRECGHIIIVNKPESSRPPVSSPVTAPGGSTIDLFKEMQGAAPPQAHKKKPRPSAATAPMPIKEVTKGYADNIILLQPSAVMASQPIQEEQKSPPEREPLTNTGEKAKAGGLPVSMLFIFALLYTIISTIGVLGYFYFGSFANVLNRQLDLRTDVIVASLLLVGVVAVIGIVIFIFLSRLIAKPLAELTDAANRINEGGLDLPIVANGPREVRELAAALERMRFSCKK